MATSPPFSKSADRNKEAILEKLRDYLAPGAEVLEIASGTGQHAVFFAASMPDIIWQPSDRDLDEFGVVGAIKESGLVNARPPIMLDVTRWPNFASDYDAVYSANCIHVMPHRNLEPYIRGAAKTLKPGGMLMLYGPFKYDGAFTTESNEQFDAFLRGTYDDGGIRDFEEADALATANGLSLFADEAMPANNRFIVWQKTA